MFSRLTKGNPPAQPATPDSGTKSRDSNKPFSTAAVNLSFALSIMNQTHQSSGEQSTRPALPATGPFYHLEWFEPR